MRCLSLVGVAARGLLVPIHLPSAHRDVPAPSPPLPVESQAGERRAVTVHHHEKLHTFSSGSEGQKCETEEKRKESSSTLMV